MIRFECDYAEGAHERILNKLLETNFEQTPGYGEDDYCEEAKKAIKKHCECEDAYIQFLVGGTQTNLTVITAALRPHQGVIAAGSGHISTHESGAIEACGHKVLALAEENGKLTAAQIEEVCASHAQDESREHTVQPKMVYISNPTESGTLYSKRELEDISRTCRKNKLYLFLDGARLGYGLTAAGNDLTLPDIARYCDVFYIGGTKVGALFGEAVVITNPVLMEDFRYIIKQRGGMLAKGRLLGIQFLELFCDGLYFEIAAHANKMAMILKDAFRAYGCDFLIESNTNQQFPIFEDETLKELKKRYSFSYWQRVDETHSAVRFCTSWATKEDEVQKFVNELNGTKK